MTVEVKFTFDNHDEALVFLARASQTKVAAAPARTASPAISQATEKKEGTGQSATPASRKPRNDAGKSRGPHNKQSSEGAGEPATTPITPAAGTPAPEEHKESAAQEGPNVTPTAGRVTAPPVAADPASPDPIPQTAPGQPIPDEKDCQAAMTKVWEFAGKDQIATCRSLLERFGVKRIGEIGPDLRAEFIAKCEGVLKGEPV